MFHLCGKPQNRWLSLKMFLSAVYEGMTVQKLNDEVREKEKNYYQKIVKNFYHKKKFIDKLGGSI